MTFRKRAATIGNNINGLSVLKGVEHHGILHDVFPVHDDEWCVRSPGGAYSTEMSRASMMNIALILDAILLASIIICALIPLAILVSVLAVALFVLVLVLLVAEYHHTPRSRRGA